MSESLEQQTQPTDEKHEQLWDQAIMQLDQWDLDNAEDTLQELLEIDPDDAEAINKMGVIHARRQNFSAAENCFNRALRMDPNIAMAHSNLGNIYQERGMTERAIREYETAIRLDPEYPVAHHNLGVLYKRTGRVSESVDMLKKAQHLDRDQMKRSIRKSPKQRRMMRIIWTVLIAVLAYFLFVR